MAEMQSYGIFLVNSSKGRVIQFPPSTTMVSPVMYDAAGDATKAQPSAMSTLVPKRRTGIVLTRSLIFGPAVQRKHTFSTAHFSLLINFVHCILCGNIN